MKRCGWTISLAVTMILAIATPARAEWRDRLPDNLRLNGRYFWAVGYSFDRPLVPTGKIAELNLRMNGLYRIDSEWKLEFAYMIDGLYQARLGEYPQYEFPELRTEGPLGLDSVIDVHTNWAAEHRMDRLALVYRHNDFTLDLGRQRIAWRTCHIMSFMDAFHPIRPGDPFAPEQQGTDAIRLQIATGPTSGWDMLYAWIDDEGREAVAVRYHETRGVFESALSAGRMDGADFIAFQTTGDVNNIGVRAEVAWRDVDTGEPWQLALESDFAPNENTYLSGEIFYNGPGATKPIDYSLEELAMGQLYPARWYAGVNCSYNPGGLSTLGLFGLTNLTDDSWFFDLSVQRSLSNSSDMRIGFQHFEGKTMSEYGLLPDMLYVITTTYF